MSAVQVPASRPARLGTGRLRTLLVLAAVAVLVVAAAWFVGQPQGGSSVRSGATPAGSPPRVGEVPPDFTATAVDGSEVSLAALAGKPIWLTFGASWCPDCRAEATDLQAAYAKHAPAGLAVVGVFNEGEQAAEDYAGRVGFTFPVVADPQGTLMDLYRVYGLPIHFFVGRDGTVRDVRIGRLTPEDMESLVQQIVNG